MNMNVRTMLCYWRTQWSTERFQNIFDDCFCFCIARRFFPFPIYFVFVEQTYCVCSFHLTFQAAKWCVYVVVTLYFYTTIDVSLCCVCVCVTTAMYVSNNELAGMGKLLSISIIPLSMHVCACQCILICVKAHWSLWQVQGVFCKQFANWELFQFFFCSLFPLVSVCAQPLLGLASIFIEWMDGLSAC